MLRHVTGSGGVVTFMFTSVTCTCYVTSLGWGGVNVHVNLIASHAHATSRHWVGEGVNVHVNLCHMHMLRDVTGLGVPTFMLTRVTCTCYVTSLGWGC